MSTIRKRPTIETIVENINKGELVSVLNNTNPNLPQASFLSANDGIYACVFTFEDGSIKNGILINKEWLIAYSNYQQLELIKLDFAKHTFKVIDEYLDINELRRLCSVQSDGSVSPESVSDTIANAEIVKSINDNGLIEFNLSNEVINRFAYVLDIGLITFNSNNVAEYNNLTEAEFNKLNSADSSALKFHESNGTTYYLPKVVINDSALLSFGGVLSDTTFYASVVKIDSSYSIQIRNEVLIEANPQETTNNVLSQIKILGQSYNVPSTSANTELEPDTEYAILDNITIGGETYLVPKVPYKEMTYEQFVSAKKGELNIGDYVLITDYHTNTTEYEFTIKTNQETITSYAKGSGKYYQILAQVSGYIDMEEISMFLTNPDVYLLDTQDNMKVVFAKGKYDVTSALIECAWSETLCPTGTIYFLEDLWGNSAWYDFFSISFRRTLNSSKCGSSYNNYTNYFYLFSVLTDINNASEQLTGDYYSNLRGFESGDGYYLGVYGNHIAPRYETYEGGYAILQLPDVVFIETDSDEWGSLTELPTDKYGFYGIYGNEIGSNSGHLTFYSSCYSNKIGDNCVNNEFGCLSHSNEIGNYFQDNNIANEFQTNKIGNHSQNNLILSRFRANTIDNEMSDCQVGNDCKYNHFGNRSNNLDLWDGCSYNQFGNFCHDLLLHGTCLSNTFLNDCYSLTLNGNCNGNLFASDYNGATISNSQNKQYGFDLGLYEYYVEYETLSDIINDRYVKINFSLIANKDINIDNGGEAIYNILNTLEVGGKVKVGTTLYENSTLFYEIYAIRKTNETSMFRYKFDYRIINLNTPESAVYSSTSTAVLSTKNISISKRKLL